MEAERDAQPSGESHHKERDYAVRRKPVLKCDNNGNGGADQCEDGSVDENPAANAAYRGGLRHRHCQAILSSDRITCLKCDRQIQVPWSSLALSKLSLTLLTLVTALYVLW